MILLDLVRPGLAVEPAADGGEIDAEILRKLILPKQYLPLQAFQLS